MESQDAAESSPGFIFISAAGGVKQSGRQPMRASCVGRAKSISRMRDAAVPACRETKSYEIVAQSGIPSNHK